MKKKLLINALLVVLPIMLMYAVQHIAKIGLRNRNYTVGSLNDIQSSQASAQILVSGSSRAKYQFSPAILEDTLKKSVYNIAISGWNFPMQHAMFKMYMQHNKKPLYIIQSIDQTMLEEKTDFFEYEQFIPYANDPIIHQYTNHLIGRFTWPELYLPLFRYNNHLYILREGLKGYFYPGDTTKPLTYKGFIPNNTPWDGSFEMFKKTHPDGIMFSTNSEVVKEFHEYISYCCNNNIHVILVFPPIYNEEQDMLNNRNVMIQYFADIAKKHKIPYINYCSDTMCYNKSYFFNSQHLNVTGSEIFSRKLAHDIKPYISED